MQPYLNDYFQIRVDMIRAKNVTDWISKIRGPSPYM